MRNLDGILRLCCLVLLFVLPAAAALADPPSGKHYENKKNYHNDDYYDHDGGHGKKSNKGRGKSRYKGDRGHPGPGISIANARDLALRYGCTGYHGLPPGVAANFARGKPLPPGIAKKMVPHNMLAQLPMHPGYEWRVAGQDLILIQISTNIVADILSGVFH